MDFNIGKTIVKIIALFSVVRGYNLVVIMLAKYLAAVFIFSKNSLKETLLNPDLNLIITASTLSVAAGYIINNFYDLEKDKVDKPLQHYVNRFIPQSFKLNTYITLNALALIASFLVSYRVALFFIAYQFCVWLYSHKINKIIIINNLWSVLIRILPFFALLIYYHNYASVIFVHALFLTSLLLILDIIKDLSSKTADLIYNYKTIPTEFGAKTTKYCLYSLMAINTMLAIYLANYSPTGNMRYYFYFSMIGMLGISIGVMYAKNNTAYKILYQLVKFLILIGVISIVFIKINPLALQEVIS